jgi:hypothetical protein
MWQAIPAMNLKHHPLSPYKLTEEQAYIAVTSGYHWVPALSPDSKQVRTLVKGNGYSRLGEADPIFPIYLFNPVDF